MLQLKRQSRIMIRSVGPFDLGRLSRLHRACFDEGWSRTDLAHLLALPGSFGLIARMQETTFVGIEGARSVGFSLCRVVKDESELLSLGVVPDYRRRRIAAELLKNSMARCLELGARLMFLEVAIDNLGAQKAYEAHGFERVGTRPDYYQRADGTRVNAFTMRCELDKTPPTLAAV